MTPTEPNETETERTEEPEDHREGDDETETDAE